MSVLSNNILAGSSGQGGGGAAVSYSIEKSLRFTEGDTSYLNRTFSSTSNSFTVSFWMKLGRVDGAGSYDHIFSCFGNDGSAYNFGVTMYNNTLYIFNGSHNNSTGRLLRDPSAWYHVVCSVSSNTGTLYVNNEQVQQVTGCKYGGTCHIGNWAGTGYHFDGYLADVHFVDGTALAATDFGEFDATTGVWNPKAYTSAYGTNGFHLPFSDNSSNAALGTDTSGNGNTWTVNNISAATGGPTSVAAASGALPIYNTTDTYGTVKGTGTRTDSNSSSLVLALPMDGANNSTTFTDESATIKGSGSAKTVTANGNAKTITSESKFYGASADFAADGTDYLEVPHSSDLDLNSATNFTVEAWVYVDTNRTYNYFVSKGSSTTREWAIATSSTTVLFYWSTNGIGSGDSLITISHTVATAQWNHIAAVKLGSTITLYVNGTAIGSGSFTSGYSGTSPLYVGRFMDFTGISHSIDGKINDLRIYKGSAKYTSNFVPTNPTQDTTIADDCDSLVDVPTNGTETDTGFGGEVRGNYATLNPLSKGSAVTLSDGNLQHYSSNSSWAGPSVALTGFGMTVGKWYWECTINTTYFSYIGIAQIDKTHSYIGKNANSCGYLTSNGAFVGGGANVANPATVYTANATLMFAYDADAKKFWVGQNGTWFTVGGNTGDPANGNYPSHNGFGSSGEIYTPATSTYNAVTTKYNFGQRPFAYNAPSGFKALCTTNLPAPTLANPSEYMDVKLYTGTSNTGTVTVSGLAFSPDLVWVKNRTNLNRHGLADTIRGVNNSLASDRTDGELTTRTDLLTSFNSDGFTVGGDAGQYGWNYPSASFAAWCWDAGSSTVTNNDGTITSQVRANTSAGFSIVTYTPPSSTNQATVGHGLSTPKLVIIKNRSTTSPWIVFTTVIDGSYDYLVLNETRAVDNTIINLPTSSVFSVYGNSDTGAAPHSYIAYCFAPVAGYSSFGSYTGNGSTDGSFTYLEFLPKLILIKRTDTTSNWTILDTSREGYNVDNDPLYPNLLNAEGTTDILDITSNGFKLRTTDASVNASGGTYIYAAFAESPFSLARAR